MAATPLRAIAAGEIRRPASFSAPLRRSALRNSAQCRRGDVGVVVVADFISEGIPH
jgi:hypothetical protein